MLYPNLIIWTTYLHGVSTSKKSCNTPMSSTLHAATLHVTNIDKIKRNRKKQRRGVSNNRIPR